MHFLEPDTPVEDFKKNAVQTFSEYAFMAFKTFQNAGLGLSVATNNIKVSQFLNRLLGLELKLQSQVFAYW